MSNRILLVLLRCKKIPLNIILMLSIFILMSSIFIFLFPKTKITMKVILKRFALDFGVNKTSNIIL